MNLNEDIRLLAQELLEEHPNIDFLRELSTTVSFAGNVALTDLEKAQAVYLMILKIDPTAM